jgi:hypothetical protein
MTEKIKNELIKKISYISGFVTFANVDISKKVIKVSKKKFEKAFNVEKINNKINISIGIIVDMNVRIKAVVSQIDSTIKNVYEKNNEKIDETIIYVRGVK